ncbi:aldo/keto reductase [Xanthovirga aplysinae]|uniref:aldo/keto reductase n=1 Tax=Xanthovirga aplysinae TaxID=2529853 RepID=UPI0012BB9CF5|nr:aldo/keto reductase [Xanthovirga aplysinae]MTI30372.1 oxidoreductase [Xanthovirga aplysinae]
MKTIQLSEKVKFSQIIQGLWRLADWKQTSKESLHLIEECLEMGITSFDHADIYGDYSCEALFGEALKLNPSLRDSMQLITKCGIKLISSKRPEHSIKYYDTSKEHIQNSVQQSLKNLGTDHIDLLLIHRPDPFMNPSEVAEAFSKLREEGKVLEFGVSNFLPSQFKMLSTYLDFPLITNQIEVSVLNLEQFHNGTLELCQERQIAPMAWSPLGGGSFFTEHSEKNNRIRQTLKEVGEELGVSSPDQLLYAWLLAHPAQIMPIVGSGKIERIRHAAEATKIKMSREQWFKIYCSSLGHEVA